MKKLSYYLMVFAICMAFLSVSSCKKSNDILTPDNCDELSATYSNATSTYLMDPTQENCEAFVQAAENFLDHCGVGLTPAQRQEYQDAIDAVPCSN